MDNKCFWANKWGLKWLWTRIRLLIVRNELVNFPDYPTTIEPWFSFLCTIARRISLLMIPRIKHVWSVQCFILRRLLLKVGYVITQGNGRTKIISSEIDFPMILIHKNDGASRGLIYTISTCLRCKMLCPKACYHHRIDAFVNALWINSCLTRSFRLLLDRRSTGMICKIPKPS